MPQDVKLALPDAGKGLLDVPDGFGGTSFAVDDTSSVAPDASSAVDDTSFASSDASSDPDDASFAVDDASSVA